MNGFLIFSRTKKTAFNTINAQTNCAEENEDEKKKCQRCQQSGSLSPRLQALSVPVLESTGEASAVHPFPLIQWCLVLMFKLHRLYKVHLPFISWILQPDKGKPVKQMRQRNKHLHLFAVKKQSHRKHCIADVFEPVSSVTEQLQLRDIGWLLCTNALPQVLRISLSITFVPVALWLFHTYVSKV